MCTCILIICMPYMYALYVHMCIAQVFEAVDQADNSCVPYMYALYVCLICMPICMPYMYALYVCLICMPICVYMCIVQVFEAVDQADNSCVPYMYALYVCLICVPICVLCRYFKQWTRLTIPLHFILKLKMIKTTCGGTRVSLYVCICVYIEWYSICM